MRRIWFFMKKTFLRIVEAFYEWRQKRLHRKAIRALRCLGILDDIMKERGICRGKRRQFWRDVIKDGKASKGAQALFAEPENGEK